MMSVIWAVYSLFAWAYIIIFFTMVPLIALPLSLIRGLKRAFRLVFRAVVRIGLFIFGCTIKVEGLDDLPQDKTIVLVSNHTGFLDPFLINGMLGKFFNFVVFAKFLDNAYTYVTLIGCGLIVRKSGHTLLASKALINTVKTINKGESFIIFPSEGVIFDGSISGIRPAFFSLVEKSNAIFIPVYITPTIRFHFLQKPFRSKIIIGKPMSKQEILLGRDPFIKKTIAALKP
jgi:1-acyl-sn-glycerol-3-phosphate acyltransferase